MFDQLSSRPHDAIVVGSGPNGLAAAVRLAQEGLSVLLVEGAATIGGSVRSAELTVPGFTHDICSANHPLAVGSPYLRQLPLAGFGLQWIEPPFPVAHPLPGGRAAVLERSVEKTAALLGKDQAAYERLMNPLVDSWEHLAAEFLQPLPHVPRHPLQLALLGLRGFRSAASLADSWFDTADARALVAGLAAHSFLPLDRAPSAAFGLVLGMMGHGIGWPLPRGGAQKIAGALGGLLQSLGGEIVTGCPIRTMAELPRARITLLDVTPRQFLAMAGQALPAVYRRRLESFRYGPGVFKVDYALSAPIPWEAGECSQAGTVHVGGSFEEIARAEADVCKGKIPEAPFVLLAQPTLFDPSRAPEGKHIAWAYCHVPNGSSVDMTERIEKQIERFAPGFFDSVLARRTFNCAEMESHNPNLVGGSINGGATDLRHLLARPVLSPTPYRTPIPRVYLCSSSTPPGGGVHGMCGFHAAELALRDWVH